jgi:hypothetical protein
VGYTALSLDEFQDVCVKCAQNDTRKIDWVICGGVYFYSDTFDHYLIAPLRGVPINLARRFPDLDRLQKSWGNLVETFLTDAMFGRTKGWARQSVVDLVFDLGGVRYIKPAPRMPPSKFWPGGRRPRDNSSGIEKCPPVALTFPELREMSWTQFKEALPTCRTLKESYSAWIDFARDEEAKHDKPEQPFVFVEVEYSEFADNTSGAKSEWRFRNICEFAAKKFDTTVRKLIENASDAEETNIVIPEYISSVTLEIGQDKANDLSSIYLIRNVMGLDREEPIIQNKRLFFEHALSIAGAYAVKHHIQFVRYRRIGVEGE